MTMPRTSYDYTQTATLYEAQGVNESREVLRNTYTLLALSMVPTILGAHFGIKMVPILHSIMGGRGIITSLLLLLAMIVVNGILISLVQKNSDTHAGIAYLALFTGFTGFIMSPLLYSALHIPGGEKLIILAAGMTGGILAVMAFLANFIKIEHQSFIGFLTVGLGVVILTKLIGGLFGNILYQIGCALSVILFSSWIIYDIRNIINGSEGNYIRAALSIYISVCNVFMDILQILLMFSGGSSRKD